MIGIISYGCGNIMSIKNMLDYLRIKSFIIDCPKKIKDANKLILPGVGSFDNGINKLVDGLWIKELEKHVLIEKKPILGICLGMQLMCNSSQEGNLNGLGWINAKVLMFSAKNKKVPHMGWNELKICKDTLFKDNLRYRFYFVHSYYVSTKFDEIISSQCEYGSNFTSSFEKENIFGVQFHPEKSHKFGMEVLKNFNNV
jgi:imidazole glycerol-phosphate synthase subunit HisH